MRETERPGVVFEDDRPGILRTTTVDDGEPLEARHRCLYHPFAAAGLQQREPACPRGRHHAGMLLADVEADSEDRTLGLEDDAMGVKDPRAEGDRRPRRPRHVRRSAPGSERCFVRMGGPAGSALLPSTPCHLGGEVAPARKAVLPGDGELGRREVQAFGHDASSDVRVRVRARRKTALPMRGTSTARWTPSFARTRWRPRTRPRCYLGSRAEARSASAGDCHPSRGITYHPHGGTPTAAGSAGGVLRASRAVWTPLRLHDAQSQCSSGSGQRGIEGGHLSVHLLGREEYAAVRHLETGRSPQAGQAHRSVRV